MKALLYCTKQPPYLVYGSEFINGSFIDKYCLTKGYSKEQADKIWGVLNGKIIGECDFAVEEIKNYTSREKGTFYSWYEFKGLNIGNEDCELLKNSCLTFDEISDYLLANNGKAVYIKNLYIFDEPRYLDEVKSPKMYEAFKKDLKKAYEEDQKILDDIYLDRAPDGAVPNSVELLEYIEYEFYGLKKAPQNMMYVYDGDEKKVLISIRPQWMCKICNREKDIEVRKIVLKEMLPDD